MSQIQCVCDDTAAYLGLSLTNLQLSSLSAKLSTFWMLSGWSLPS